jgi:hypothetical protein
MFTGAPLPLSPDVPLGHLLACADSPALLGAWLRGCQGPLLIHRPRSPTLCLVLASADLGFLLGHCPRVAVREGQKTRVLSSEAILEWRALQVATATPYLPGIERVRTVFPRLRAIDRGFVVPLEKESPEEVLARCVRDGVRVTGSRVIYCAETGDSILPVLPQPP